jgi:hypothetical protein
LCHDRDLGFQIVAYIMGGAYEGGPHDHGSSWAIYGQAVRYTDMTEWARVDDGSKDGFAKIEKAREYRLERGDAGIFDDHQIHSISYPSGARFIRVTGTDLSTIKRGRFNPKKNTVSLTKRENFQVAPNAIYALRRDYGDYVGTNQQSLLEWGTRLHQNPSHNSKNLGAHEYDRAAQSHADAGQNS